MSDILGYHIEDYLLMLNEKAESIFDTASDEAISICTYYCKSKTTGRLLFQAWLSVFDMKGNIVNSYSEFKSLVFEDRTLGKVLIQLNIYLDAKKDRKESFTRNIVEGEAIFETNGFGD